MATDDSVYVEGSRVTLEASGAATANGVYTAAGDKDLLLTDDPGFPYVVFALEVTLGTTQATVGEVVSLYKVARAIDGTNDELDPNDDNQVGFVYSFPLDDISTAQRWESPPIPRSFVSDWELWIHNDCATGDIDAGWKLYATPVTHGPSA
jgi:hypothetical protein